MSQIQERLLIKDPNREGESQNPKLSYYSSSSTFSKLFFTWVYPVMSFAHQKSIKKQNFEDITLNQNAESYFSKWQANWQEKKKQGKENPLYESLKKTYMRTFLFGAFLDFLNLQFNALLPVLVFFLSQYLQSDTQTPGWNVFWLLIPLLTKTLKSWFEAHADFILSKLGVDLANSLGLGMTNKALRYSILCNKKYGMGELVNFLEADCLKLSTYPKNLSAIFSTSYFLIFAIVFMAVLVGVSFLAGLGVMIVASVINSCFTGRTRIIQSDLAKATDSRMRLTNEVFNNIKFIKVNAWEEYFYDKLVYRRTLELAQFKNRFLTEAYSTLILWMFPKLILAATFGTYIAVGGLLTPAIAFSVIFMYAFIQFFLQNLPVQISSIVANGASFKRIQTFLLSEEVNRSYITNGDSYSNQYSITVKNGNFFWDLEQKKSDQISISQHQNNKDLHLENINIKIKRGSLVAVVGDVGSGKSSLIYCLIGEMKYKADRQMPSVQINGSTSLVTQKPWIINATVKDNILFGKPYDETKYQQVIHYACLKRDLELFTHGDATMIGEKGATLSGGQKARISFARSLYSDSDTLFLDDLLSAVDVYVGKFLMVESLLRYCKNKTRILVTHAVYYLKYFDHVIVMHEGKIADQGTPLQIRDRGIFQKLSTNVKQLEDAEDVEDIQYLMTQQIVKEASIHSKKSRQSAIDQKKLESLRQKKSKHSKKAPIEIEMKDKKKQSQQSKNNLMLQEKVKTGGVDFSLYKSYISYNGGAIFIIGLFLIQFIWMFFNAGTSLWITVWTEAQAQENPPHSSAYYLGIYILIILFYSIFSFVKSLVFAFSTPKMSNEIHQKLITNLLFTSLNEFFDRVPIGRILNRLSKDLNAIDVNLYNTFSWMLLTLFFAITNTFIICILAPYYIFLPIIFVYFILAGILARFYSLPSKQIARIEAVSKSPIISSFAQILSGTATIRAYKVQHTFFEINTHIIDESKKPMLLRRGIQSWFSFRLTLLSILLNVACLVYILFFWIGDRQSTNFAANASLIVISALGFDAIFFYLLTMSNNFENELISLERCNQYLNLTPEKGYEQYLKNRPQLKIKSMERRKQRTRKQGAWPQKGNIDFINLKCRYRSNLDLVLKGLDLRVQGGHKVGVVGRTGCGKSTIMLCLLRILQAEEGQIVIDGKDIAELSLEDLRSCITIIMQDPCLISGTIRQNLDPLNEFTDSKIIQVLDDCKLRELIDSRNGLDTEISQNGQNLSVGERQLVSIARAIIKPTKIVLVDEATANIDAKTEEIIYMAMNKAFKNSTVITIAHRLNTVINSDRILVLEDGRVKEYDNPKKLLENPNSFFAELYNESQKEQKH